MNYIVLDLEWDSAYYTAEHRFINQILQIGAVKLNDSLAVIDSFDVTVRSSFSKRVSGRFAGLTGITSEKMRAGIPFEDAVRMYNEWAGTDTVTMTWSTSDLFAIVENQCLLPEDVRFHIEKYVDIQKYIQNELALTGHGSPNQIALSHAAELFEISTEEFSLHTARDDSMVCVALLRKTYNEQRFSALIRDTASPDFYKRLFFKPYYLNDLNDPLVDKTQFRMNCEKCGSKLKPSSRWSYHNRSFQAKLYCAHCHQKYKAQVSFRKNFDGVAVKRRLFIPQEVKSDDMQSVSAPLPERTDS